MSAGKRKAPERAESEENLCRICLSGEDEGPLKQPCACRGSSSWAHDGCLARWRRTSAKEDAGHICGQCRLPYHDALSIELLKQKLRASREAHGDKDAITLSLMNSLGNDLSAQGHHEAADLLLREALEGTLELHGERHPNSIWTMKNLAKNLTDQTAFFREDASSLLDEAHSLLQKALQLSQSMRGSQDEQTIRVQCDLAANLYKRGKRDDAEAMYREIIQSTKGNKRLDYSHSTALGNLGQLLSVYGRWEAAEELIRAHLAHLRKTVGARHPDTLSTMGNLAGVLEGKGDLASAVVISREALKLQREVCTGSRTSFGAGLVGAIAALGLMLKASGELEEALQLLQEAGRRADGGNATFAALIRELKEGIAAKRRGESSSSSSR